jgi:hypothetical protein
MAPDLTVGAIGGANVSADAHVAAMGHDAAMGHVPAIWHDTEHVVSLPIASSAPARALRPPDIAHMIAACTGLLIAASIRRAYRPSGPLAAMGAITGPTRRLDVEPTARHVVPAAMDTILAVGRAAKGPRIAEPHYGPKVTR